MYVIISIGSIWDTHTWKPLQLILINVLEKLTPYLTEPEEQNERTKKSHEKLCKTTTAEDFVRSISTYTSVVENV